MSHTEQRGLRRSVNTTAIILVLVCSAAAAADRPGPRKLGVPFGTLAPGPLNAITDVAGVRVGHVAVVEGDAVRTGVTAVVPHGGNVFQDKVPAAAHVANGFGKLAGSTQIRELGQLETPIVLTNTLSVPTAADAVVRYILALEGNEDVRSVNPVVGETNDGWLNTIRGRHVTAEHVLEAIRRAKTGPVEEGAVGAGTGTVCFGFKGGIGTSSRVLPEDTGGFTVGVLVQTNFGGDLMIGGIPVGRSLAGTPDHDGSDGSCMIIVATDAPLCSRNLERLARRAILGLARTGGISSNGSGDYVIAFSTAPEVRMAHGAGSLRRAIQVLRNDAMTPLFQAVIEATEEAIINSLFAARDVTGRDGHTAQALPADTVLRILRRHNVLRDD